MSAAPTKRYDSLDLWRGIACLLVVYHHSASENYPVGAVERIANGTASFTDLGMWLAEQMWIGVGLFFVISGYCIAATADAQRRVGLSPGRYFVRRFRRIYPPLWVCLGLSIPLIAFMPPAALPQAREGFTAPIPTPDQLTAAQWAGNLTLTESWRSHVVGPERQYFLGHIWTLCYEEQFYLVVGLILLAAPRLFFPAVLIVTLAVILNPMKAACQGFFFDGLWVPFAAGVGVYYRVNRAGPLVSRAIELALIGWAAMAAVKIGRVTEFAHHLDCYQLVGASFALLLCWLHPLDSQLATARVLAPVRFCGRMCYSLYLVHAPVTALLCWNLSRCGLDTPTLTLLVIAPLGVLASVAVAYPFHRFVERRFLNAPPSARRDAAETRVPSPIRTAGLAPAAV